MKGVELPINILVVVAIAVIVLLGLVALYFIGFNPISVTVSLDSAKNNNCRTYLHQNPICNDAIGIAFEYPTGTPTSLAEFTNTYYGCTNTVDPAVTPIVQECVRRVCGCPGY